MLASSVGHQETETFVCQSSASAMKFSKMAGSAASDGMQDGVSFAPLDQSEAEARVPPGLELPSNAAPIATSISVPYAKFWSRNRSIVLPRFIHDGFVIIVMLAAENEKDKKNHRCFRDSGGKGSVKVKMFSTDQPPPTTRFHIQINEVGDTWAHDFSTSTVSSSDKIFQFRNGRSNVNISLHMEILRRSGAIFEDKLGDDEMHKACDTPLGADEPSGVPAMPSLDDGNQ